MTERDALLERLRTRVHLPPAVFEELRRAVSEGRKTPEDALLEVGFDATEVERLLGSDATPGPSPPAPPAPPRPVHAQLDAPATEDQTINDEVVPRISQLARPDEPTVDELIGRLLDITSRFDLQGEIARGAMGRILSAWDLHLGRPVAIKVLRKTTARDLDRVRFLEEAQVTGQLQHPNIVPVYELGRLHDQVAFVMRRIEGRSLKDIIGSLRRGDPDEVAQFGRMRILTIFHQLCLAVAFAHTRGVVHRDLKPSNVMVGDFGEVALLDWGLCKVVSDATRSTRSTSDRWRTVHGQIIGTPAYMAPEQAMGLIDQVDARTDVYGLGAILYHLLTLRPPFIGKTNREIVQKVLAEPLPPLRVRAPEQNIPPELDTICQRCMAREPSQRFTDARELAQAIEKWLERPEGQQAVSVEDLVSRGVAAIARQQNLMEDMALVRDNLATARAQVDPQDPPERKQDIWEAESRMRAIEIEVAEANAESVALLSRAVTLDSDHSEARALLCEQFLLRHERAAERGDEATAAFYRALLREYDDGQHTAILEGTGALQVETHPRGAHIRLWRCFEKNRRLVPATPRDLGMSPARIEALPAGIYRLTAQAPDHEMLVGSLAVTAGQSTRVRLRLLPAASVPQGFVHIPAGTFRCGTQAGFFLPAAEHALPDYLMSALPVTCGQYVEFLREAGRRSPSAAPGYVPRSADGRRLAWRPDTHANFQLPGNDSEFGPVDPDEPITGITYLAASAFCQWLSERDRVSYRLPTEEEWEKAARGAEGRVFPWGNRWEPTFAATAETWATGRPPPVGQMAGDCSPYGVYDLAGGVREWTSTLEPGSSPRLVVRGGSFLTGGARPLWVRDVMPSDRTAPDVGFRLCRDVSG
jgi:serine/threonine protein kinase/formylglycine-generating enzyme required for sulfatase activity